MRKVSIDNLPTIDKIIEVLPSSIEEPDKQILELYLNDLNQEYQEKIDSRLYDINIENLNRPAFFDYDKAKYLYTNYIRKEEKEVFISFPTVKNVNNAEICPICEGVLSTKVTLEHIIPKGRKGDFRFAILPINLIKCCVECNTPKHQEKSSSPNNSEINPYAEDFRIEEYFEVDLVEECGGISPRINFSFSQSCFDERIKNFIDIYNLKNTYKHRLKLEYHKIISTLSNSPEIFRKTLLYCYLNNLKESYRINMEYEKSDSFYWIDQNYFGFQICDKLIYYCQRNQNILDRFINDIIQVRHNPNELVFENIDFFTEFESVSDLIKLIEFVSSNETDLKKYFCHLKKYSVNFSFPNLYKDVDSDKKGIIEAILKYYLETNKSLETFEQKISNILE